MGYLQSNNWILSYIYRIPSNGYYFFVFNSENEVQSNFIRVQFDLDKAVYNISNSVADCRNRTESCAVSLDFFSSEKLVMELPVSENSTLWNEEFIVISECEPRTAIYMFCMIMVPILVTVFAFSWKRGLSRFFNEYDYLTYICTWTNGPNDNKWEYLVISRNQHFIVF